jgi:hypothetical protein
MTDSPPSPDPEGSALPVDRPARRGATGGVGGGPVTVRRTTTVGTVVARVVRWPGTAGLTVLGFVLRWALRLALPVAGAAAMLHTFPYTATVQGVPFEVQGTVLSRAYVSADTTLGSWVFPHVSHLPVGVHVEPVDINLLQVAGNASGDTSAYVARLQHDFVDQLPRIGAFLAGELLLGILLGLGLAAALNMSVRYLRGFPRRHDELRIRLRQLTAAMLVLVVVAVFGAVTYNPRWTRQSRLTGTLAAAQLFPDQLAQYYSQQSKASDVVNSVLGIQGALQNQFQQQALPPTAFPIMFISDVHLASAYPLVRQYAENYGVKLIVNTGDESEFGRRAELTAPYLREMSALTSRIPMLWLAGNHDSPEVADVMRKVPGVTVLGHKATRPDGTVAVSADVVDAFGLTIAGLPDPRIYGGPGAYGSDAKSTTDPLERSAVERAVSGVQGTVDIFATHEPVAADRLRSVLPDRIRQTNSGHTHMQNASGDLQSGKATGIDLVEGSTGAGGLDNLNRGVGRPPIEFSIETVGTDCQFTRVQRFSITAPSLSEATDQQRFGNNVNVATVYFRPQRLAPGRTCGTGNGIGAPIPIRGRVTSPAGELPAGPTPSP